MAILISLGGLGAGTLSKRVGEATVGVAAVGALPLGFQVKLGMVRGKHLLAVFMRLKLLMSPAHLLVLLGLLLFERYGPQRCPLPMPLPFLIFSMVPDEEPRIFRMLDFISRGAQGHGPVHLAWDGAEKGWIRVSLPPLRMMTGPIQYFFSSILDAWLFRVFAC